MNALYGNGLFPQVVWSARTNEIPKDIFERKDAYQFERERFFYGLYWHPLGCLAEFPHPSDLKFTWIGEIGRAHV